LTVNHRTSHGLQVSGSYTLAKSMDTNSGDGTMSQQDSTNLAESYALSDFDVRHRVSFNASYELPFKGNRVVEGWQINVVEQAQTGGPFNITTNIQTITGSATVRPDLTGAARAQFRIEVFNLFNQSNLNLPGRTAAPLSTSFGVVSSTRFPTGDSGSSRQIQFAAKFLF